MSDIINRQDAIEAIVNREMRTTRGTEYLNGYAQCQLDIIDIIQLLPSAQPEQRWIPCSERLPEKEGRYLVTCSKWGAWEVDWNIWNNDPKPSWLWEQGVSAWMPLPEPWKGEDDEADRC